MRMEMLTWAVLEPWARALPGPSSSHIFFIASNNSVTRSSIVSASWHCQGASGSGLQHHHWASVASYVTFGCPGARSNLSCRCEPGGRRLWLCHWLWVPGSWDFTPITPLLGAGPFPSGDPGTLSRP